MSDPITPEAANMANKIGHLFLNEKKLHRVFEEEKLVTSKNKIFHRLVDWMKANPSDSKHFPGLLRFIDLRTMVIDDLVTAFWPLKLIDGNVLLDIVYEQMQKGGPLDPNKAALGEQKAVVIRRCPSDDSVAASDYSFEDETPGTGRSFARPLLKGAMTYSDYSHVINGNGAESITIDLECIYLIIELFENGALRRRLELLDRSF